MVKNSLWIFPKPWKSKECIKYYSHTKKEKQGLQTYSFCQKITTINKSNLYNKNNNWTCLMFIKSILKWMKLHNCSQIFYAHHSFCFFVFFLFGVSPHICGSSFLGDLPFFSLSLTSYIYHALKDMNQLFFILCSHFNTCKINPFQYLFHK